MNIEDQIKNSEKQKRSTAVLFGILAGLAYGFVAWGISGFQLMQSHAILPWLAFVIGAIPCMIVAALAALISIRIHNLLLTPFIWIINGLFFAYMGRHVQFQFLSTALKLLAPEAAAHIDYPVTTLVEGRGLLIYIIITVLSVIVGLLSTVLIESASASISSFGRVLPAFFWMVFFGLAGFVVYNNYTQLLTQPVVSTNSLIQFAVDHQGQNVDIETANSIHLRTMEPIQDLLNKPRRLVLATYDEEFTNIMVAVDFGGSWVSCSVIGSQVNYCEKPK